jgi:16S rRNA (cytosine1402-N4)-methyltransferase
MTQYNDHIPVMLGEVIEAINPTDGETYVDGTFGAGGYSSAILDHAACKIIGFDRDINAYNAGQTIVEKYSPRLSLINDRFSQIENRLNHKIDGFVLDIGVSSMQLDQAERGFSFMRDGPLDMRMGDGETASELIERLDEKELADIIYLYGDERKSRHIAKAIKANLPIHTTLELAGVIETAIPRRRGDKIHPATRTFQALRIVVNDELGELERALEASINILNPGGRLVIVTFHSLEDRIVKNFLKNNTSPRISDNKYAKVKEDNPYPFKLNHRKAIQVSETEAKMNPRSRSAKMRVAIRTAVDQ